jgi:hypothetical protein
MSVWRSLAIVFAILIGGAIPAIADASLGAAAETAEADAASTDASKSVGEVAPERETVTIPLENIWSNGVRGAKSLRSLEPWTNRMRTPEENEALRKLTPEQIKERLAKAVEKSLVLQIERADIKVATKDSWLPQHLLSKEPDTRRFAARMKFWCGAKNRRRVSRRAIQSRSYSTRYEPSPASASIASNAMAARSRSITSCDHTVGSA